MNETLPGLAQREKSGAGGVPTVTAIDAALIWDPFVPVIATVYEPAVEDRSVHVDVWPGLMLEGEQVVVTPDGLEDVVRATVPLKPFMGLTNIVEVAGVVPSAGTVFGRVAPTLKS